VHSLLDLIKIKHTMVETADLRAKVEQLSLSVEEMVIAIFFENEVRSLFVGSKDVDLKEFPLPAIKTDKKLNLHTTEQDLLVAVRCRFSQGVARIRQIINTN